VCCAAVATWRWALGSPRLLLDLGLTSLCSALGQLFVFYTVAQFGAVQLAVVMTARQALSVLLSCWLFGHAVAPLGYAALALLFGGLAVHALLLRPAAQL